MRSRRDKLVTALAATAAVCAAALVGPTDSHAQARSSLESMRAALCAKATADGDSYRPVFCSATCPCDTKEPYGASTVCDQVAPGYYEVTYPVPFSTQCWGRCSSGVSCISDSGCVGGGGICHFTQGQCSGLPGLACTTDAFCAAAGVGVCNLTFTAVCTAGDTCTTDLDCPLVGFFCRNGYCSNAVCPIGSACTSGTADLLVMSLTNVGAPDSLDIAQCGPLSVNSNDAAACISQVETALGQVCAPPP